MVKMKSLPLELRGIAHKVNTTNGNVYYIVNCEDDEGTPHQFYCPNDKAFADGLKKGDSVTLTFAYSVFDRRERLSVIGVEKAV